MSLGEALARAPALELVVGNPVAVASAWERTLEALEEIGAAVEPQRPGLACFDATGMRRLHGGSEERVIAATRRTLASLVTGGQAAAKRSAADAGLPIGAARIGDAATRFCALAAASCARPRRPVIVRRSPRDYLRQKPVALLRSRSAVAAITQTLERLGISTLGELAALPRASLADRFGQAGVEAHRLACGEDDPPRPRPAAERLHESLELPESASGPQLERALGVLIDRLLARTELRGRSLRTVVLEAQLVSDGSWRAPVAFREATCDPQRMRLALAPRLALLPAPATGLALTAERFGPPSGAERALFDEAAERRAARLREAVEQTRAALGSDAALRVLPVDLASRVPERRMALTPFS
jgi:protein ImuB